MNTIDTRGLETAVDKACAEIDRLRAINTELLAALEDIVCPECDHILKHHADRYGCQVDRGDRPGNEGEPAQALGNCCCNAERGDGLKYTLPDIYKAIAVIRKATERQ